MIIFPKIRQVFLGKSARSLAGGAGLAPRPTGILRKPGGGSTGWHHAGLLWLRLRAVGELMGGENPMEHITIFYIGKSYGKSPLKYIKIMGKHRYVYHLNMTG